MSEVLFVLKSIVITAVIIVIMQIRLGSSTLEEKAFFFIYDSKVGKGINTVADDLVKSGQDGFKTLKGFAGLHERADAAVSKIKGRVKLEANRSQEYLDRKRAAEADND